VGWDRIELKSKGNGFILERKRNNRIQKMLDFDLHNLGDFAWQLLQLLHALPHSAHYVLQACAHAVAGGKWGNCNYTFSPVAMYLSWQFAVQCSFVFFYPNLKRIA
jgi:hypothetical protein